MWGWGVRGVGPERKNLLDSQGGDGLGYGEWGTERSPD